MVNANGSSPKPVGALGSALVVMGAAACLAVVAQPWALVRAGQAEVAVTGTEVTGGLIQALAIAVLAGWLLGLTLRRKGRRIVGGVVSVLGLAVAAVSLLLAAPSVELARERLRTVSLAADFSVASTWWPQACAASGLIIAVGGLLTTRGRSGAGRFERGAAKVERTTWDRIDAGEDPTLGGDLDAGRE